MWARDVIGRNCQLYAYESWFGGEEAILETDTRHNTYWGGNLSEVASKYSNSSKFRST